MQQYFCSDILHLNDEILLSEDILYHLQKVLRKDASYTFRIADGEGKICLAHLSGKTHARIIEILDEDNELPQNITVILSLIKQDKFEWALQKLTELGAARIVPYIAERTQIVPEGKKKWERFRRIVQEAAEQSHRNRIPELCDPVDKKGLSSYLSDQNLLAYEKEDTDLTKTNVKEGSVSLLIGPEGGFSEEEIAYFKELGFRSLSLGKRILRAETAAVYLTAIVVEKMQ